MEKIRREVREAIKEVKVEGIKTEEEVKNKGVQMKKSSLWMVISGILVVLFLVSIFTGGFRGGGITGGAIGTLSSQEAADKALTYINTNLFLKYRFDLKKTLILRM